MIMINTDESITDHVYGKESRITWKEGITDTRKERNHGLLGWKGITDTRKERNHGLRGWKGITDYADGRMATDERVGYQIFILFILIFSV